MSAGGTGQATGVGGDMPATDPAGAAVLERRYLRLLRCYPPTHREEMLGVLLAAARPGQRTPGLGQAVNLAACGLVIRVRRIPGWLAADAGQDALAVVSLIAPAVVFILLALGRGAMDATAPRVPLLGQVAFPPSVGVFVVVMIAWLAVMLLGLSGCRRTAAAIASIPLTLAWVAVLTAMVQQSGPGTGGLLLFPAADFDVVLASLAACSLALSPGPWRGLAIVGWRRACLMIAGLSAGFGFPAIVQLVHPAAPLGDLAFRLLGVLAIALAVAVTCVPGPVGRRVAGLVAAGLLPSLAVAIPPGRPSARHPACRRAGVAGGDRVLAGAGQAAIARGVTGAIVTLITEGIAMSWSSRRGASAAAAGRPPVGVEGVSLWSSSGGGECSKTRTTPSQLTMPSQLRDRQILPPGRGRRMCRGCRPRPFGKPKTT